MNCVQCEYVGQTNDNPSNKAVAIVKGYTLCGYHFAEYLDGGLEPDVLKINNP